MSGKEQVKVSDKWYQQHYLQIRFQKRIDGHIREQEPKHLSLLHLERTNRSAIRQIVTTLGEMDD